MIKVLTVIGTRPEAIKLAPVIRELERRPHAFQSRVAVTGQHKDLLDQVLAGFQIVPDYRLDLMTANQALDEITASILTEMGKVIRQVQPDVVLVQGDTTTVFATALAAFFQKVRVGHVEAGLRTNDKYRPFPEEIFRRLADRLSDFYFAPTEANQQVLLQEGVPVDQITVTGNTVIDALNLTVKAPRPEGMQEFRNGRKLVLLTAHRRESFGQPLENVFDAVTELAQRPDLHFIYPVHPNPNVRQTAGRLLGSLDNVTLVDPLDYASFVHTMNDSWCILSDSGGVQEEAPTLNKPVLVLRDETERQELVERGGAILVGTDREKIVAEVLRLLNDDAHYRKMSSVGNPFGDGRASIRIVDAIQNGNGSY